MPRSLPNVIRLLILGDLFMFSGFGLIGPIFAVYVSDRIPGGSIAAAGYAATIFLLTETLLKIPIARFTDKDKGYKREALTLLVGTLIESSVPLLYLTSNTMWQIYLAQVVYGVGFALAYPGWMTMFTRHADRGHEGFEWSVYSSAVGIGAAFAAAIGGTVAQTFGFSVLFYFVFLAGITSSLSYALLLWYTLRNGER
ncbi:MAG: hypothetical protein HW383_13 [Candidatus Magasanikbacteria bacterium]|nr:hypothetical protein [Candidatus Magasanikbacteria bacterium]